MQYRHHISISTTSLPEKALQEISAIAPEGQMVSGFRLQVDSDSPDGGEMMRRITAICAAHGLKRRRTHNKTCYGYYVDRCYGDDRLLSDFLILTRQVIVRSGVQSGTPLLANDANYRLASVLTFSPPIVVSEQVRQVLEPEKFIGMRFSHVEPDADANSEAVENQGPFWELRASTILPKMANIHQFVHPGQTEAEPFHGDYSRIILIDDPPFNKGEVHYRQSELSQIERFDVARTFENYTEAYPALVVSKRFYQFCLSNRVLLSADPVRIDEA